MLGPSVRELSPPNCISTLYFERNAVALWLPPRLIERRETSSGSAET